MKILVTGAYGQLGSELKEIIGEYPKWTFLFTDADTLDITDRVAVQDYFQKNLPELVINCAAYTAVDKAEADKELARKINAEAPGILAKAAEGIKAKIIHISTDYVFNGQAFKPYVEEDSVSPTGVYGETKLEGEKLCLAGNTDSVVIRTSWLYSFYGNNFVKTMLRLGSERDSINVIFDQVGTPTYATDLARAILSIAEILYREPKKIVPGVYHYSNEGVASWYDFTKAIFECAETNCEVNPILTKDYPTAAKRPHYSVLDKSKIKDTFGLKIPYWKDSLHHCVKKLITK